MTEKEKNQKAIDKFNKKMGFTDEMLEKIDGVNKLWDSDEGMTLSGASKVFNQKK